MNEGGAVSNGLLLLLIASIPRERITVMMKL